MVLFFLHKNMPSELEVENFIRELMIGRDKFLKKEYGSINNLLLYEGQYNNFNYLKNMEVITETEFEHKIQELNKLHKVEKSKIGFIRNDEN